MNLFPVVNLYISGLCRFIQFLWAYNQAVSFGEKLYQTKSLFNCRHHVSLSLAFP